MNSSRAARQFSADPEDFRAADADCPRAAYQIAIRPQHKVKGFPSRIDGPVKVGPLARNPHVRLSARPDPLPRRSSRRIR